MGKSVKKAVKKIKKVVSKVTKTVVNVAKVGAAVGLGFAVGGYAGAAYAFNKSGGFELTAQGFTEAGNVAGQLGFDSLEKETERWASDIKQVGKVLSGEYARDQSRVADAQELYQNALDDYEDDYKEAASIYNSGLNELIDKMNRLIGFHEIFQMSMSNKIENYGSFVPPDEAELLKLFNEFKKLSDRLKNEYDFIIGLKSGGILEKVFHSMITIIGGITRDMIDAISGEADTQTWKRIGGVIVAIVLVVIAILAAIPTGGASLSLIAVAIAVLTVVSTLLMLDGMYGSGSLMGATFDLLDFVFNDVFNFDDLIGSDFNKFDSDHEDYQEMTMYFQMALAISAIILSLGSSMLSSGSTTGQSGYTSVWSDFTTSTSSTSFLGINASTYKSIYDVYQGAMSVKDYMTANDSHNQLKDKLNTDLGKINNVISKQTNKNFMKHYKDTEYFLNDQQLVIDRYLWEVTADNMYTDPYAVTPVANIRFSPDKRERKVVFGFEELFDYESQAGGNNYFKNILYMT